MTAHQRTLPVVLALGLVMATASAADANARKRFRTTKQFGVGLMVGEPSGLSAKLYLRGPVALAFGLGSSYYGDYDHHRDHYYDHHGVHFHVDALWHPVVLTRTRSLQLPLHIGVGAQVRNHDDYDRYSDHSHVGVRVPFGITMDFTRVPLDVFFELAFAMDFIGHDDHTYFAGSLGARYYF